MYFGLKNGRKAKLAKASRKVATKYESTPVRLFPMIPKEKAHIIDTIARLSMFKIFTHFEILIQ